MPRATKFLKEDIIEAACAVVKKEGLSAINARRVAKELGCSVQPIFYQFENMEDIPVVYDRRLQGRVGVSWHGTCVYPVRKGLSGFFQDIIYGRFEDFADGIYRERQYGESDLGEGRRIYRV